MPAVRQQLRSLGALLMEKGLLTRPQLDAALVEQKVSGEKLGRILVARGWVRDRDILTVLNGMMVVVFSLGGGAYCMETLQVREIIRYTKPRPLSGEPAWLEGVIDHRGRVVPVVGLGARLGLPAVPETNAVRIVIYEGEVGRVWGLKVDSVSAVVQIPSEQLDSSAQRRPEDLPAPWFSGMARFEGKSAVLLNVEGLLIAGAGVPRAPGEALP